MHRFEQRKRPAAVVPSALAKNKHQAVWVEALPLLFCVRCSSFPDRLDTGEIIQCTDSGRENAMWQPCCLLWEKINVKRYGGSPAVLFFVDAAAFRIGLTLAERFDAQIRVEKTPCGSRAVCVGKK